MFVCSLVFVLFSSSLLAFVCHIYLLLFFVLFLNPFLLLCLSFLSNCFSFVFLPLLFILFIKKIFSLTFFLVLFFLIHVFFLSLSFSFMFVFLSCSSHFPCSFFLSHFCSSLSFICFSITLLSFPLNIGCLELASLATWCTTSSRDRKDWLESVMEEEVPQPS